MMDEVCNSVFEKKPLGIRDEWLPFPRYLLRKNLVKKLLKNENLEGKNCLEIGYGAGDMLLLYSELGLKVYAFDFSDLAYKHARQKINGADKFKNNVVFYKKETEITQIKYDYIMAFEVLEHIEDDYSAFKNWGNLLTDYGKIIFSVPAHKNKWGDSDIAVGHYRRYEKEEIEKMCIKNDIKINYFWCYGFPLTLLLDPILNFSKKDEVKNLYNSKKEELSKESGVKRKKNILFRFFFNNFFLFPFYLLQNFFKNRDSGSGYIILGEKIENLNN